MSPGAREAADAVRALVAEAEAALNAARPQAVAALACDEVAVEVDGGSVAGGREARRAALVDAIGAGLRQVQIDVGEVLAVSAREARAEGRYLAEVHPLDGPPRRVFGDWAARLERRARRWCVAGLRLDRRLPSGPRG